MICKHLDTKSGRVPFAKERGKLHFWPPRIVAPNETTHESNHNRAANSDLVYCSVCSRTDESQSIFCR